MTGRASAWVSGIVAVVGAVVAGTWVAHGAIAGFPVQRDDATHVQQVAGVEAIDLDVAGAAVHVAFGDVDAATLEVSSERGDADDWRLDLEHGTLVVASPDRFGPWAWGWWRGGEAEATLTLPASLEGVDASLSLGSGSLWIDGALGDVDLEASAGDVELEGSTGSLDVDMSAGTVDADVRVDGEVALEVSAGSLEATITGDASAFDIDVSAGDVRLEVPDAPYAVTVDASVGDPSIDVTQDPAADRTIDVDLSAGSLEITAAD